MKKKIEMKCPYCAKSVTLEVEHQSLLGPKNKIYLARVDQLLQPKNKLQSFIQNYIKTSYDRKLIPASDIELTKQIILKRIAGINLDHAKCTPVKVYWWTPAKEANAETKDWVLGGCEFITFSFLCGKEI